MDAEPLNLVRPEVPVELAALVAKMMAKEPDRRFQTPGEVAQALMPFFKPAASQLSRSMPRCPVSKGQSLRPSLQMSVPRRRSRQRLRFPPWPGRGQRKTGANGVAWESLIAIDEVETLIEAAKPKPAQTKPGGGRGAGPSAAVGPAADPRGVCVRALALGVIIYVATDNGRIKIVVDDPKAIVQIDGKTVRIEGLDEPITLRTGDHVLTVVRGGTEDEVRKFVVLRGDGNESLRVEYQPGPGEGSRHPSADKMSAPQEAVSFRGSRYRLFHEQLTWHEAATVA